MQIDWWTLALQAVNFLILVWLLQRFLYKPVMKIVERRRQANEEAMAQARKAEDEAKAEAATYREKTAALAEEREQMLRATRAEIEAEHRHMTEEARRETEQILAAGRQILARERSEALEDLRRTAIDLAVSLAEALLGQATHGKLAEAFLERLDEQITAMSEGERDHLLDRRRADTVIEVATAPTLDDDRRDHWRQRLGERLGWTGEVTFSTDESLIAGARIVFPAAVLEAGWGTTLEQAKARLTADGQAA